MQMYSDSSQFSEISYYFATLIISLFVISVKQSGLVLGITNKETVDRHRLYIYIFFMPSLRKFIFGLYSTNSIFPKSFSYGANQRNMAPFGQLDVVPLHIRKGNSSGSITLSELLGSFLKINNISVFEPPVSIPPVKELAVLVV